MKISPCQAASAIKCANSLLRWIADHGQQATPLATHLLYVYRVVLEPQQFMYALHEGICGENITILPALMNLGMNG